MVELAQGLVPVNEPPCADAGRAREILALTDLRIDFKQCIITVTSFDHMAIIIDNQFLEQAELPIREQTLFYFE